MYPPLTSLCYPKNFSQIKNPAKPTYFTNRALCHLKLKRWDHACQDCRKALDLDQTLVKGHFFLGQSLLELECYDEAIKHLQRGSNNKFRSLSDVFDCEKWFFVSTACDLAKEQRRNFGDDIASQLRLARKKRFTVQEEKRICEEIELQTYINRWAWAYMPVHNSGHIWRIFFSRLINDDMQNRIAKLKLDESLNEETTTEEESSIVQECVSS